MKKYGLAILATFFLFSCHFKNNSDEKNGNQDFSKKELLFLMSGIWVNEYDLTAEIDLLQEKPYRKDKWGNKYYLEIVGYDLDNMTVVAKELNENEGDEGVTMRLIELPNEGYALAWKYDTGKLLLCNFVRKLDRFIDK